MAKKRSIAEQALSEIKRIERLAKIVSKRGYTFNLPFRYTKTGKEKTRFTTKELEQLKTIKTPDLYQYAKYGDISGEERRKQERSEAARKAAQTVRRKKAERERQESLRWQREYAERRIPTISEEIIDEFLSNMGWRIYSDDTYKELKDFINHLVEKYGIEVVASGLEKASAGFISENFKGYTPVSKIEGDLEEFLTGNSTEISREIADKMGSELDAETFEYYTDEGYFDDYDAAAAEMFDRQRND